MNKPKLVDPEFFIIKPKKIINNDNFITKCLKSLYSIKFFNINNKNLNYWVNFVIFFMLIIVGLFLYNLYKEKKKNKKR